MYKLSFLTILLFAIVFPNVSSAQNLTGPEILMKSMKYHDPAGKLEKQTATLTLNEPRPGGEDRISTLVFSPYSEAYSIERSSQEGPIRMWSKANDIKFSIDGKETISEEQQKKHRLTSDRFTMMRNYYHYLWYLPMKLSDPGTVVHENSMVKDFFGKSGYEVKVTYDPEVGKDTWYFYFDTKTFAMIGYRFYHDESKNDGEYITLEGEVEGDGVRIPKTRKWYKHQKDEYLGMDVLMTMHLN